MEHLKQLDRVRQLTDVIKNLDLPLTCELSSEYLLEGPSVDCIFVSLCDDVHRVHHVQADPAQILLAVRGESVSLRRVLTNATALFETELFDPVLDDRVNLQVRAAILPRGDNPLARTFRIFPTFFNSGTNSITLVSDGDDTTIASPSLRFFRVEFSGNSVSDMVDTQGVNVPVGHRSWPPFENVLVSVCVPSKNESGVFLRSQERIEVTVTLLIVTTNDEPPHAPDVQKLHETLVQLTALARAEPTEPTAPTAPTAPTEPAQPAQPAEPAESAEPANTYASALRARNENSKF